MLDSYHEEIAYIQSLIGGSAAFSGKMVSIFHSFGLCVIILLLIERFNCKFA